MKSCRRCFEYAYVFVGGDVRMCPWNGIIIGNLIENTLEDIWKSEKAEEIRRAFMRGELLGCNEQYCPHCINKSAELEIESDELLRMYDEMSDVPTWISLAYDERCNHACPSCRHDFFKADCNYLSNLDKITTNIEPYIKNVKTLAANGIGDLFVSTEIVDMLSRLEPVREDFSMYLETNGVLFKHNWEKIKNLAGKNITVAVTPNSFDKETYKYLAGVDDLEEFEESLLFISELKHKGDISRLRLIMVIQDSNFRQIPKFIQKGIDYDCDEIVLRPIFKWFGMNEDELLFKNVLNPCHPYYKEYMEIIQNPICNDPRVFNWGFQEQQESIEFPTLEMKRQYEENNKLESYVREKVSEIRGQLNNKKVVLYGAGKVGRLVLCELTTGNEIADVQGFVVTCADCSDKYYMGYPIFPIEGYENNEKNVVIIATTNKTYKQEMIFMCEKVGIKNYITIN